MISEFIDGLLNFHFLQNALITALVIGIVGGAVGCFIILRGMSLMGDAISHAVLPGVAISFILGINFFIGAIIFGLLASTMITYIKSNSIIKSDTAIGITFSSFLALGIILIGVANSSTDLFHILFGNILAVQDMDMWITIIVSLLVLATITIFFRPLLLTSFDPILAKSMGVKVTFYHYLLMVILTLVSVTAMQSVGTILIVALLITPAATAYLYVHSLKTMILLSSGLGALASVLGLFIGYSFNIAAGSSIVLTSALLFLISFFIVPKQSGMNKILSTIVLLLLAVVTLTACTNKQGSNKDKLRVVTTNSIIADITKNIAGDKITLHSIVPVGKDPHEYEPLPDDVKKTSQADLIFYNGINLETGGNAWFTKLVKNAHKTENKDYFAVSDGVEVIYLEGQSEKGKEDPHAWLNLENGIIYAQNIAKQLIAKDPKNKTYYEKNLKSYTEKLSKLDQEAKETFNKIPDEKKLIVTSEGCFKYFSKAYGVPSAYIWEINTEEEGTPEQIKTLVEKLRQTKVPALFVESSVDERPMKTVSKDTNIPIYAKIFTDSIAEKGQDGDSYYNMMKYNLDKITQGLNQ